MGIIGFTAKLELNDGDSNAFVIVDEATLITLPTQDATSVETTYLGLGSPDKTFTPGLSDPGVLSFECNYRSGTYTRLMAVHGYLKYDNQIPPTGAYVQWRVTAPDEDASGSGAAQTFTMNGFLTKLDTGFEIEGVVKIKGEVKISGGIMVA